MQAKQNPVRLAIVEDDAMVLARTVQCLEALDGFAVVIRCGTCAQYMQSLEVTDFDVLLTDLGLPDGDGCQLIRATRARRPEVEIIVLTVFGDEASVVEAIRSGATGYLLKDDNTEEIGRAIGDLRAGLAPISPGIARFLVRALQGAEEAGEIPLTPREVDVLGLAAKGFSNREIAGLLKISANTVASYTKQIYQKLAVTSRNEAVYEAGRLGILKQS